MKIFFRSSFTWRGWCACFIECSLLHAVPLCARLWSGLFFCSSSVLKAREIGTVRSSLHFGVSCRRVCPTKTQDTSAFERAPDLAHVMCVAFIRKRRRMRHCQTPRGRLARSWGAAWRIDRRLVTLHGLGPFYAGRSTTRIGRHPLSSRCFGIADAVYWTVFVYIGVSMMSTI